MCAIVLSIFKRNGLNASSKRNTLNSKQCRLCPNATRFSGMVGITGKILNAIEIHMLKLEYLELNLHGSPRYPEMENAIQQLLASQEIRLLFSKCRSQKYHKIIDQWCQIGAIMPRDCRPRAAPEITVSEYWKW